MASTAMSAPSPSPYPEPPTGTSLETGLNASIGMTAAFNGPIATGLYHQQSLSPFAAPAQMYSPGASQFYNQPSGSMTQASNLSHGLPMDGGFDTDNNSFGSIMTQVPMSMGLSPGHTAASTHIPSFSVGAIEHHIHGPTPNFPNASDLTTLNTPINKGTAMLHQRQPLTSTAGTNNDSTAFIDPAMLQGVPDKGKGKEVLRPGAL
ncbi:hypothetical protein F5Y16DRAFT_380029 [Xylariaceae sp. FL0255]|nr:hypothetical protein F5Y16DRAFT_380029 [Xylariaceae sp. FL0255]